MRSRKIGTLILLISLFLSCKNRNDSKSHLSSVQEEGFPSFLADQISVFSKIKPVHPLLNSVNLVPLPTDFKFSQKVIPIEQNPFFEEVISSSINQVMEELKKLNPENFASLSSPAFSFLEGGLSNFWVKGNENGNNQTMYWHIFISLYHLNSVKFNFRLDYFPGLIDYFEKIVSKVRFNLADFNSFLNSAGMANIDEILIVHNLVAGILKNNQVSGEQAFDLMLSVLESSEIDLQGFISKLKDLEEFNKKIFLGYIIKSIAHEFIHLTRFHVIYDNFVTGKISSLEESFFQSLGREEQGLSLRNYNYYSYVRSGLLQQENIVLSAIRDFGSERLVGFCKNTSEIDLLSLDDLLQIADSFGTKEINKEAFQSELQNFSHKLDSCILTEDALSWLQAITSDFFQDHSIVAKSRELIDIWQAEESFATNISIWGSELQDYIRDEWVEQVAISNSEIEAELLAIHLIPPQYYQQILTGNVCREADNKRIKKLFPFKFEGFSLGRIQGFGKVPDSHLSECYAEVGMNHLIKARVGNIERIPHPLQAPDDDSQL